MSAPRNANAWLIIGVVIVLIGLGQFGGRSTSVGDDHLSAVAADGAVYVELYDPVPDLQAADAAIAQKQFRTAQLHAIRILGHQPDHTSALLLLLKATSLELEELAGAGEFLTAGQRLEDAEQCFLAFRDAVFRNGTAPSTIGDVQQAEESLQELATRLRDKASRAAREKLKEARESANRAYSYVWYNNRGEVRKGLRQLRWLETHFEYLNADTRGEYFRVLNVLKRRVSDREWAPLLAEAGFLAPPAPR